MVKGTLLTTGIVFVVISNTIGLIVIAMAIYYALGAP